MFFAVLGVMVLAAWFGGLGVRTPEDYFLAGRRLPWWVAALSLVATELSVMTVLGISASAFHGNWTYLQFFAGAAAGRVLVALAFVPAIHRSGAVTIYGFLGGRLGPCSRAASAGLFFASRLLAAAARLAAAGAAAGLLMGWPPELALALLAGVGTLAVVWGGLRAAVWANAVQALVVLGAGAMVGALLLRRLDGGLDTGLFLAAAGEKLRWFDAGPSLWPVLLGGFIGSAAGFGTDHDLMQRALAARSPAAGRRAVLASIAGSLASLLIFLSLGTLLFVYYKQNPGLALPDSPDGIYPHFLATSMSARLRAAALAGIVLASIDLPLPALSAAFVEDVWKPAAGAPGRELLLARGIALWAALSLAALAWNLIENPGALVFAVKAGVLAGGALLGVFALAACPGRRRDRGPAVALAVVAASGAALLALSGRGLLGLPFAWHWLIPLGAAATFVLGLAAAPLLD
ncbi:MAG: hypothetical protein HY552_06400 [Elusimicrobia bacterium]|nr:hypothetical protein [Elusimicrobiota bacterium]